MQSYLLVAFGGAVGSVARYWLAVVGGEFEIELFPFDMMPDTFPWPTLWANLLGSLVIGFVANMPVASISQGTRLLLMMGVCGGFTTFSSFSLQMLDMIQGGSPVLALAYAAASVVLGLFAVALGYMISGLMFY